MSEEKKEQEEKKTITMTRNQMIKIVILAVFTILSGLLAWFSLARIINNGLSFDLDNFWVSLFQLLFPVLAFCLWVGFVGLDAIFIKRKLFLFLIHIFSNGIVFLFFRFSLFTVLVFLMLMVAYFYFSQGIRKEKEDRLKFHVLNYIKIHLGLTMIFCVAAVSLIFYEHISSQQSDGQTNTNEILAASAANFLNIILETQFKDYDPEMTLDEFVLVAGEKFIDVVGPQLGEDIQIEESIKTQNIVSEIEAAIKKGEIKREELPPEIIKKIDEGILTAQDIISAQATDLFSEQLTVARDDFIKQLGIEAQGSDKISEVIKNFVRTKLSEGLLPYANWLPPLLAISLFFTLVIFDFLYVIFVKIFALLMYILMLITKFIIIKKETKEAEIAELS